MASIDRRGRARASPDRPMAPPPTDPPPSRVMDDAKELGQPRRAAQVMLDVLLDDYLAQGGDRRSRPRAPIASLRDSVGSARTESASCTPRATAKLKETYLIR
jgi:hypothetical protein